MDPCAIVGLGFGGLCAIGLVAHFALTRKTTCPHCKRDARALIASMPSRCDHCREYFRLTDGAASAIEPGTVYKIAIFKLSLEELADPSTWKMPWEGRCCVCNAPAGAAEVLTVEMNKVAGGNFAMTFV